MRFMAAQISQTLKLLLAAWFVALPAAGHDFGIKGKSKDPTSDQPPPANCDPLVECCDQQTGMLGNPVDAYTGRKTLEIEDLVVPGVVPIRMLRQYNSQSRYDSPLGYGWSFTYDYRLFTYADPSDDRVVVRGPEGRRYRYLPPQSGSTFESADPGAGRIPELELVAPPTSEGVEYIMTLPDGQRALFDTEGRLYAMQTPQGNRLRFLYIDDEKKPLTGMSPFAVDPLSNNVTVAHVWRIDEIKEQLRYQVGSDPEEFTGRSVTFKYDSNGRIEYIESHDRRRVVYSYDEGESHPSGTVPGFRGNLAQVTGAHQVDLMEVPLEDPIIETYRYPPTPQAESPRYEFEHIHNLTYYDTGEGTAPHIATYDAETDRVVSQDLTFSHWQFQYTENPSTSTTATRTITTPDASGGSTRQALTTYEFNASGIVTAKVDALQHRTEYPRVARACPASVKVFDAANLTTPIRETVLSYSTDARLTKRDVEVTEAQGTTVTVTMEQDYFGLGPFLSFREARSTKPDSNVFRTEFEYLDADADGLPENLEFLKVQTDTPGTFIVTEFGYDPDHGQLTLTTPPSVGGDALSIRREYFSASDNTSGACGAQDRILEGRLRSIQVLDGGTPDAHLRRDFCYDVAGNVSRITDALGHVTELAWDGRGRLVRRTEQIGGSSMTWESTLFRYGAPNEGRTEAQDTDVAGHDLLQVETGALGPTGTSVSGHVRRFVRDSRGRIVEVQSGAPGALVEVAQHKYDSDGNRIESSEPTDGGNRRTLTLEYDEMHQLTKVIDSAVPTANETEFAYDPLGNRKEVTDAREQRTEFIYDELDRLIRMIQHGESLTTNFEYDPVGNVTGVEDPKIQTTTYEYDTLSRLVSVEQHLGQTVDYEYDDRNRLEKATNARGQALLYEYFIWGGLDKLGYDDDDDGTAERVVDYTYDFNGNIRTVTDAGTLLWDITYDDLNRVDVAIAKYIPGDPSLDSDYDAFGNRTALTLADGHATSPSVQRWIYDPRERLTATCMPQDEPCTPGDETLRFAYYDNEDLKQITHDNGAQPDLVTDFMYHEEGPIESITVGTAPLHKLLYTVDPVLNVDTIQETISGTIQTPLYDFDYDDVYRLTDASYPAGAGYPPASESFPYDTAGNRDDDPESATPWQYDSNNRILASPGALAAVSYVSDEDGNIESRNSGGIVQSLTWDATSRLIEHVDSVLGTSSYAYDPFGRRLRKTTGGSTTWYLWDGVTLLAEYGTGGIRQVRYGYAGGYTPAQVNYDDGAGSETTYHVHSDHLDTPRMLTDESNSIVWRASYSAFGRAYVTSSLARSFNFRYPGQYYDAETELGGGGTGFHYNKYRNYDPSIGRYVSSDPIGQYGTANRFEYGRNNPSNFIDPFGLFTDTVTATCARSPATCAALGLSTALVPLAGNPNGGSISCAAGNQGSSAGGSSSSGGGSSSAGSGGGSASPPSGSSPSSSSGSSGPSTAPPPPAPPLPSPPDPSTWSPSVSQPGGGATPGGPDPDDPGPRTTFQKIVFIASGILRVFTNLFK